MSMKNSPYLVSFSDISLEKIVMHDRHSTILNTKYKVQNEK